MDTGEANDVHVSSQCAVLNQPIPCIKKRWRCNNESEDLYIVVTNYTTPSWEESDVNGPRKRTEENLY